MSDRDCGLTSQCGWFLDRDTVDAAYWFGLSWRWRSFLDPAAYRSTDFMGELSRRGWHPIQEWHTSRLVLRLYGTDRN
jgi:hypothetical protein